MYNSETERLVLQKRKNTLSSMKYSGFGTDGVIYIYIGKDSGTKRQKVLPKKDPPFGMRLLMEWYSVLYTVAVKDGGTVKGGKGGGAVKGGKDSGAVEGVKDSGAVKDGVAVK